MNETEAKVMEKMHNDTPEKKELRPAPVDELLSGLFYSCKMNKNAAKCETILELLGLYPRSKDEQYILGFSFATLQIYDAIPNPMER